MAYKLHPPPVGVGWANWSMSDDDSSEVLEYFFFVRR